MTDRPDVSAGSDIEVFQTRCVRARDDEEVTGCDGVPVHEDHCCLVLVDDTGVASPAHDGAEDARLLRG